MNLGPVIHQGILSNCLITIFPPTIQVLNNAKKELDIKSPENIEKTLELDIWIPSLKLGFEFQDAYHYISTWYSHKSLASIALHDTTKNEVLRKREETIVVVPCWWDGKSDSLMATIQFFRPDLAYLFVSQPDPSSLPIDLNPSHMQFKDYTIHGVGEMMLASVHLYPRKFFSNLESNSWWMGEKYDGMRCCWHPEHKELYTRFGFLISLPSSFTGSVQSQAHIDGELWFGRGNFTETQTFMETPHTQSFLRIVAFDSASLETHQKPFENRYGDLLNSLHPHHPFLIIAKRVMLESYDHFSEIFNTALGDSGEGVILRKVQSEYIPGRSEILIKFKASRHDKEALVVRVDAKRDDGRVPILLRLPNYITFTVHASELVPKEGDIVTFSFDTYSLKSIPLNPKLERIRKDMSWEDVLRTHFVEFNIGPGQGTVKPLKSHKMRKSDARAFFEKIARSQNLDPLKPSTWYNMDLKTISKFKGHKAIFVHYGGYINSLLRVFSDIGLQASKFAKAPRYYYLNPQNRKEYLLNYAKTKKFDPLITENWYKLTSMEQKKLEGGHVLSEYYNHNLVLALDSLFPSLHIDPLAMPRAKKIHKDKLKVVLLNLATKHGFDPLVPDNWYSISMDDVLHFKGGATLKTLFGATLQRALLYFFPNIGFQKHLLLKRTHGYWSNVDVQKHFFEEFAMLKSFDPLIPENWYSVSLARPEPENKNLRTIVRLDSPLANALMKVFPNIGLDYNKFSPLARSRNFQ